MFFNLLNAKSSYNTVHFLPLANAIICIICAALIFKDYKKRKHNYMLIFCISIFLIGLNYVFYFILNVIDQIYHKIIFLVANITMMIGLCCFILLIDYLYNSGISWRFKITFIMVLICTGLMIESNFGAFWEIPAQLLIIWAFVLLFIVGNMMQFAYRLVKLSTKEKKGKAKGVFVAFSWIFIGQMLEGSIENYGSWINVLGTIITMIFLTYLMHTDPSLFYSCSFEVYKLSTINIKSKETIYTRNWLDNNERCLGDELVYSGAFQEKSSILRESLKHGELGELYLNKVGFIVKKSKKYPVGCVLCVSKITKQLENALESFLLDFMNTFKENLDHILPNYDISKANSLVKKHFYFVPQKNIM